MSDLLTQLEAASAEGLAPNLARFLAFLGWTEGEPVELQVLKAPREPRGGGLRWKDGLNLSAHGSTLATLTRLATEADAWGAPGVYVIFNREKPAVQFRRGPDSWHEMKDGATSDQDITHRRAGYLDLDPERADGVKGISASAGEMLAAVNRVEQLVEILTRHVPAECLGRGLSGNGCAVFFALAMLTSDPQVERLVKAVLVAAGLLLDDQAVKVDTSVSDAKRLCPAFGTMKRKGSNSTERPHRRSAFVAPAEPHRLTLAELESLVTGLRGELATDEQRAQVDAALVGGPSSRSTAARLAPNPAAAAAPSRTTDTRPVDTTHEDFQAANYAVPVASLLARLGLLAGDRPRCPGCGESDSGVAIVDHGLKCSHNRCANKGHSKGFRSAIDLVIEVEGLDPAGAIEWLRQEYPDAGIPGRRQKSPPPVSGPAPQVLHHDHQVEEMPFLPLETSHGLPTFPLEALPREMRAFVGQLANYLECPVDLPACLALGALGSACMKRFTASPRVDWTESMNIYVAIALEPGESKSPAFKQVFAPLYALQKQMVEEWKAQCERTKASNASRPKGEPPDEEPVRPRLFISDATPEKTGAILAEQGERITIASDEGTAFQQMAGMYAKNGNANIDVYLKGHDGGDFMVDRLVRDSIHLENPLLTVALAVQPTVIRGLAKHPDLRGRGLLARFVYSFPASRVGTRTFDTPPVEPEVKEAWKQLVQRLASGPLPTEPETLHFTPEAEARFHRAELEIERAMDPGRSLFSVRDWANKLRGFIARVAGLLHVAEEIVPGQARISLATVERALEVGRYFTAHTIHTLDVEMNVDPAEQSARLAWTVIERKGAARVTPAELGRWVKALRKTPDAVAALEVLCQRGYIATDPDHRGKGRAYLVKRRGGKVTQSHPKTTKVTPQVTQDPEPKTNVETPKSPLKSPVRAPGVSQPAGEHLTPTPGDLGDLGDLVTKPAENPFEPPPSPVAFAGDFAGDFPRPPSPVASSDSDELHEVDAYDVPEGEVAK